VDTRYRYTGREFDGETGLYYYRARYYDANVGRFIGQDPIGFEAGDANLYRYVENRPIDRIDPSGKDGQITQFSRDIKYADWTGRAGVPGVIVDWTNTVTDLPVDRQLRFSVLSDKVNAKIEWTKTAIQGKPAIPYGGKGANDDSGHIIPEVLGGSDTKKIQPYINNFFAHNKTDNQGSYGTFGKKVNARLKYWHSQPCKSKLDYTVELFYERTAQVRDYPVRPTRIKATAIFSDNGVVVEKMPIYDVPNQYYP
jgi:RHS repeat-associated protein